MPNNTTRTVLIGAGTGMIAGLTTVAAIVAVDTWQLDTRIPEAIARARMTSDERAEFDEAKRALQERQARERADRLQREADQRAKFRPGLLAGPRAQLAAMPLPQLIREIHQARTSHQAAWTPNPDTGSRDYSAINGWRDQLEALRSEFDRRRDNPAAGESLSRVDQLRWSAAYGSVHAFDDPYPIQFGTPTTTETN